MAFPRRALVITAVTALLLYVFGFPFRAGVGLCLVTFLVTGRAYLRLFIKTFPRDLWYASSFLLLPLPTCTFLYLPYRMGSNLVHMLRSAWMHKRQKKILSDLFEEQVQQTPDKTAVVYANDNTRWTFRELDSYANTVANYFSRLGLRKGDTVALFMENSPEYIGLYLGLWKIGVVVAFVNHNLRHESLVHCIRAAKTRALVFSSSLTAAVSDVREELGSRGEMDVGRMCFAVCGEPAGGQGGGSFKRLDQELQGVSKSPPPPLAGKEADG